MTIERIALGILSVLLVFCMLWIGYLYGAVKVQQERIVVMQSQIDKQKELLDEFNRKVATLEIKLQFCIDELNSIRKKQ